MACGFTRPRAEKRRFVRSLPNCSCHVGCRPRRPRVRKNTGSVDIHPVRLLVSIVLRKCVYCIFFFSFSFREPGLRLIRGREERSWPRSMSSQSSPEPTTLSGSHQASHGGTPAGVIAAVVVIVVALSIGVAVYLIFRRRARRTDYDPERRPRASMVLEGNHAPPQVSPYGSTSNLVPHFRTFSRPSPLFRVLLLIRVRPYSRS